MPCDPTIDVRWHDTRGAHIIKHWAVTQKRVTLSSREAELGGVVKGAAEGLGVQSLAWVMGLQVKLAEHVDSSAAIGICRRSGIGRVRHLAVGLYSHWTSRRRTLAVWLGITARQCCMAQSSFNRRVPPKNPENVDPRLSWNVDRQALDVRKNGKAWVRKRKTCVATKSIFLVEQAQQTTSCR